MALTKVGGDVIQNPLNVGIITATRIDGNVSGDVNSTGVSTFTTLKVGTGVTISDGIVTATTFSGDLTGNVTGNINSSGISTLGNTVVGGGTTQLVVTGNARITGILTIGTSSITLDGSSNQVNVGTGVTLHHTNGVQVGGNTLHSTVLTVNQINASGVVTATTFSGDLTGNATGLSGTPNITVGNIIASNATISGNVSVAGTLTYEDVTNVDSLGIVTARTGVRIDAGGLVVVGVTTVAAGSTAAPSITPTGDSDTGIFFPSADTIAFGEGGAEALRINSSGRVGIGTTNPQQILHLLASSPNILLQGTNYPALNYAGADGVVDAEMYYGAGGGNDLVVHNYNSGPITFNTNNNERLRIDSSGRVTMPYQPGFLASSNSAGANQPGSSSQDMLGTRFNITSQSGGFNTGNHYNTGTGIFTAPVAGKYYTFFNMRWETGNFVQNSYIRIFISKNDTNTVVIHQINGTNEAWSNYMAMSCSGVIDLAAGDTLRPKGGLNGGTAVGWWNESSWGAWLLG